jgi:hypothetical protein
MKEKKEIKQAYETLVKQFIEMLNLVYSLGYVHRKKQKEKRREVKA